MSEHDVDGHAGTPAGGSGLRALARDLTSYWWLSLVAGICWIVVAVAILQFDETSVRTVGLIVGFMFLFAGFQNLALAAAPIPLRWVWVTFGVLLIIAGLVSLANPEDTFSGLADMLSFLFLLVGLWWMVRAFLEQAVNPALVARADRGRPDDRPRLLDGRPVLHREGLCPARLRRHLGADGGRRRHRHARSTSAR